MEKIKLISDSTCDLSKELVKELDLEVVPLLVSYEGSDEAYKDGIEITLEQIKENEKKTGKLPSTSAVGPAIYTEIFDKYISEGYSIIYTGIGSTLSANQQSVTLGRNACKDPEKVTLIDSLNLSTCTGLLLLKIRDLIEAGKTREEIKQIADTEIVPNLRGQFSINTMDYLIKGGRCSQLAGFVVKLLSIKPIIKVVEGKLVIGKKPIGHIKLSVKTQFDDMMKEISDVDMDYCMVTGFDNDDTEKYIVDMIEKNCKFKHVYATKCGSVIGSHCGPGTTGILYLKKPSKKTNKK